MAGTFESIEQIVVLQLGQVVGRSAGRPDVDLHVLLFEGPGQVLGLVGVAFEQEHPRLARGRDQARSRCCCRAACPGSPSAAR